MMRLVTKLLGSGALLFLGTFPLRSAAAAIDVTPQTGYAMYEVCRQADINDNMLSMGLEGDVSFQTLCTFMLLSDFRYLVEHNLVCAQGFVQAGQLQIIFMQWAQRHPEQLSVSASDALDRSFLAAFPCRRR